MRSVTFRKSARGVVLDDPTMIEDDHAWKGQSLADVVCDTEKRGIAPEFARIPKECPPAFAIEPAEWFVEDDQSDTGPEECPGEANALSLSP